MAVVVSISRGHDASYPFKTIGAAEGPDITGERGAGYYLSAVEKGGEPAGTWIGNGAAELGFNDGDVVRREDFEPGPATWMICVTPSCTQHEHDHSPGGTGSGNSTRWS